MPQQKVISNSFNVTPVYDGKNGANSVVWRLLLDKETILPTTNGEIQVKIQKVDGERITNYSLYNKPSTITLTAFVGGTNISGNIKATESASQISDFTISKGQSVLVRLYNGNTLCDEKTVMCVADGESIKGDDGYGLTLTPSALIFEEKIDAERNPYVDYSNNTVSVVVYKGKTPLTPTITKLTGSYSGCVLNNITISGGTVTMGSGSISSGVASGYFTVNIKADGGGYDRYVRINFYVNRLGSWRASIENGISTEVGNQITYGLQDGGVIKTAYDAAIEKSATGLTQQFTEQISRASAESRNLFGFNKKIAFSSCLPFIQGYGLVCQPWNNTADKTARLHNLGMYGRLGYYTVSCQVRTSASNGYVRLQMNWHEATDGSQAVSGGTKGVVLASTSAWTELHATFLFSNKSERHIGTSVPEGGEGSYTIGDINGYLDIGQINGANDTTRISVQDNYIYVRHLKIEYHDFATDFCEADEDIACLGGQQMAASQTFRPYKTTGSPVDTYPATVDGRSDVYQVYVSGLNNTYPWYSGSTGQIYWDYIFKNSFANIEAGKCYTLSFWAKSSVSGFIINHYLYQGGYNLITDVDREIYTPTAVGNSYEGVTRNGGTQTVLSTEWKQYFVHFYAANAIPTANLIALRVDKSLNYNTSREFNRTAAYVYMSDIQFQEGYVLPTSYFSSLISQNARRIALVQQSGNKLAGIDIQNGTVNLFGDRVTFSDATGTIKDKVWIDPATGMMNLTGGTRSPFVYNGDRGDFDLGLSNNIAVYSSDGTADNPSVTYTLPWDVLQSGRRVTVTNWKWKDSIPETSGFARCTAPAGKYFFEDGAKKSSILLSREAVELLGFGDESEFYGWIVINRINLMTVSDYGHPQTVIVKGYVQGGTNPTFYGSTCFGKKPTITHTATGVYKMTSFGGISTGGMGRLMVMTSGKGTVDGKPVAASWTGIDDGIEIQTFTTNGLVDGSFSFMIMNWYDFSSLTPKAD